MTRLTTSASHCLCYSVAVLFAIGAIVEANGETADRRFVDAQPVVISLTDDTITTSFGSVDFELAEFQDQLPATPDETAPSDVAPSPEPPTGLAAPLPTRRRQRRFESLASVPNMFGDFFGIGGSFTVQNAVLAGSTTGMSDIPLPGGGRRFKVAENNKALPMDQVYFVYNHFNDALQVNDPARLASGSFAVDRYTFGFEKTFYDGEWSIEGRVPFSGQFYSSSPFLEISGGSVGNVAISAKRLLYRDDTSACVAGIGLDLPTGGDVVGAFGTLRSLPGSVVTSWRISNRAVHVSPFLGVLRQSDDRLTFMHAFGQLDFATTGNPLNGATRDLLSAPRPVPLDEQKLNEQALLHLDASIGRWLYHKRLLWLFQRDSRHC